MSDNRPRCSEHFHRQPCPMCLADHKAGDHASTVHPDCPLCAAATATTDTTAERTAP